MLPPLFKLVYQVGGNSGYIHKLKLSIIALCLTYDNTFIGLFNKWIIKKCVKKISAMHYNNNFHKYSLNKTLFMISSFMIQYLIIKKNFFSSLFKKKFRIFVHIQQSEICQLVPKHKIVKFQFNSFLHPFRNLYY